LTFLNEKDRPSQLDVAERISVDLKQRGFAIAGLERTGARRRGSTAEPIYLGADYEGLVYHQWYTTRAAMAQGRQIDDVPPAAIERSLCELFEAYQQEPRDATIIVGVRAGAAETERRRNAVACLQALNLQDLPRWRYRIVVIEQDRAPQLEAMLAPLADRYLFAYNPGSYNRGWAFNIGACLPGVDGPLCLIDADLLVPADFLRRSISAFQTGARALLPYTEVAYLDAAASERAIRDRLQSPQVQSNTAAYSGRRFNTAQGGCIWVDAALYRQIGGHNERFQGWGCEDREFWARLERVSRIERLQDHLLHLHHPHADWQDEPALANQRLLQRLAESGWPQAEGAFGDISLYTRQVQGQELPIDREQPGWRAWELWNTWDTARIEQIVQRERTLQVATSARKLLADLLVRLGDSLLDLGCGPGAIWTHLAQYRPRFTWVGADATIKMVESARRLFPDVAVHHVDAGKTPFADQSYDIVLLRHVLEHMPHWLMEATLTEAIRLARRAVVVDFYVPPLDIEGHQATNVGEGFIETCWSIAEIEAPIRKAGWQVWARFALPSGADEQNEVWIVAPPNESAQPRNNQPCISIIMPTYRRPHTLYRTIATVLAQTYPHWELIIIDNAGDVRAVFNDPRIRIYSHPEQPSASYARNQGLCYATGELICFFDDDDDMFPSYLQQFVETFQANPQAKLVRCGMFVTDEQVNFSYATPECCLRRSYATPTWSNAGPAQDQHYFSQIVAANGWSEADGDIVCIREALCRANADPRGGLRQGRL
jgi:SAM-dependent methyltransferase